ncbi:hypothetical protein [Aureispira sp. CCB-QB1]|uniref:hypothetical protein n=1 Tax=Aureispira sp. CCB-QB1 TaxID=1313421 RepID=UPI000696A321|nr:hypothetical protein [Aureispira sp. CCB-QB1]
MDNNFSTNKTLAQLFVGIIAVALITSQFWSCSTAQGITYINTTVETDVEQDRGQDVLLFKLLSPVMPEDGQQITKRSITDAKNVDQNQPLVTIQYIPVLAYLEGLPFIQNVSPYSLKDIQAHTPNIVLSTPKRGPPCSKMSSIKFEA